MRVGRMLIVLAILVILALVALYAVLNLGESGGGQQAPINTIDIVMVVQPISRGSVITADQLGLLAYPSGQTIQGMYTSVAEVAGRRARYDLMPGTPMNTSMLAEDTEAVAQSGSDTALLIPAGMVAFPIPIDRFSGLAYGLRAGDHVNLIASLLFTELDQNFQTQTPNNTAGLLAAGSLYPVTETIIGEILSAQAINIDPAAQQGIAVQDPITGQNFYTMPSESQRPRLVSQTLLQDIVVLHVGNFLFTDSSGEEVQLPSTTVDSTGATVPLPVNPPDIITLIVTPQDAVTLNYLLYVGAELNLALRSGGDNSIVTTEAVTLEFLLNNYNIPVPTKLPYGLAPRLDVLVSPTLQGLQPQLPPP